MEEEREQKKTSRRTKNRIQNEWKKNRTEQNEWEKNREQNNDWKNKTANSGTERRITTRKTEPTNYLSKCMSYCRQGNTVNVYRGNRSLEKLFKKKENKMKREKK